MCGRACTPRTRAAARALTGAGSRLAAWPARPFKFLSHSAAAKRAQSADWHVARGRSASPRRRSWPPARAQRPRHSRSASRRRSASERANSHCAEIHTRTEIETGNDVRPRTADYENETYAWRRNRGLKSWGRFCCALRASVCGYMWCLIPPVCYCGVYSYYFRYFYYYFWLYTLLFETTHASSYSIDLSTFMLRSQA